MTTHQDFSFKIVIRTGGDKSKVSLSSESLDHEQTVLKHLSPHPGFAKCVASGAGILVDPCGNLNMVHYLVFEKFPELSLLNFILCPGPEKATSATATVARKVFKKLAEAVWHAHSLGICGMSLTLDRIWLDPVTLQPCVVDFRECTGAGSENIRILQQKAYDIYQLGIVLFLLRTKHLPFVENDKNKKDVANNWKKLFYSPMRYYYWEAVAKQTPGITAAFINAINAMLEADPARRITAEKLLEHPFVAESKM